MRLQDRTRTDPETGEYLPGRLVDLYATVRSPDDADAAIAKAAEARKVRAMHEDRDTRARRPSVDMTVADAAVQRVAAEHTRLSASTRRSYELQITKHLAPSTLGAMRLADVTVADVADYLAALAETSGPASAKHGKAVLSKIFAWAVRKELVQRDPVRDAGAIKAPRGRKAGRLDHLDHRRALTRAERAALAWAVARDERAIRMDVRDVVLAGLALGCRLGELLAVRYQDIELLPDGRAKVSLNSTLYRESGTGMHRADVMKTASSIRTIPVPRRIAALIRRRARAAGLALSELGTCERVIFDAPGRWDTDPAGRLRDTSNTAKELRRAFDEAGYPWLSFHGIRRTAITLIADTQPLRVAAALAGHSTISTTSRFYVARGEVPDEVAELL